jgi:outer membrane protein assembly factor BamB
MQVEIAMPIIRFILFLLLLPSIGRAEDWPQWLGPRRDATSSEKVEPWKAAPPVLWRQPVGEGHSAPVVAGGRVFLHTKVRDKEQEEVACFDAATGKPIWQTSYAKQPFTTPFGNGPRATPCVHGSQMYTLGITGILTCLDTGTGKSDWQIDLLNEFKAPNLGFGVSCSPLVADGKVFVNVGGPAASIIAFDLRQPKVVWKTLSDPASYASPILFGTGHERQIVFLTEQGVVSLDPGSGKLNWKFPMMDLLSESSTTPVKLGDMLLASSVTYGSLGLRLGTADGKPSAAQAWKNSALTCYFSTPVAVDTGHVYMVTGTLVPPPQVTLRCVDMSSGKELWSKPKVGKYHASLLRTANDKLLMLDDLGNLIMLKPSLKGYVELAHAHVCGPTWAHPALANGRLYLRDEKELICLQM